MICLKSLATICLCTFTFSTAFSQLTYRYDVSGNRIKTIQAGSVACNICPAKTIFFEVPRNSEHSYRWQIDSSNQFKNLQDDSIHIGTNSSVLVVSGAPTRWYGHKYRCIITTAGGPVTSQEFIIKFFTIWQRKISSAWEEVENWSCKRLPDEFTDVIIQPSGPLVLSSNAKVRTITLNSSSDFTIKSAYQLQVMK